MPSSSNCICGDERGGEGEGGRERRVLVGVLGILALGEGDGRVEPTEMSSV